MKKRIALLSLITLLAVLLLPLAVSASCTVSASASVKEVIIGNTVKVTFSFKGSDKIGSIDAVLEYDNAKLSYTGYTSSLANDDVNPAGQIIKFSAYDGKSTATACTLTFSFKALAIGTAKVELRSSDIGDSNGNPLGAPTASVTVTVKAKPEEKLSSDCSLKDLQPPAGTKFDQKFAPGTLNYTCTVPYTVDKFPLEPITNHAKAKVEYIGSYLLKVGTNTRQVRVTAEDGTTRTYTVTITRKAADPTAEPTQSPEPTPTPVPTPEPTAEPAVTVNVNGKDYTVASPIDLPLLPGFTESSYIFDGTVVEAVQLNDRFILELDDGITSGFYFYDPAANTFTPYLSLSAPENIYTVFTDPTVVLPASFRPCSLETPELVCTGWTCEALGPGYCVLSVMNNLTGERMMAVYCEADGTVQRLSDRLLADPETGETPVPLLPTDAPVPTEIVRFITPTPTAPGQAGFFTEENMRLLLFIALAVLAVLVLIILILVISRARKPEQPVAPVRNPYDVSLDDDEPAETEPEPVRRKAKKKHTEEDSEDF